jgi:hypothetical protein
MIIRSGNVMVHWVDKLVAYARGAGSFRERLTNCCGGSLTVKTQFYNILMQNIVFFTLLTSNDWKFDYIIECSYL